ELRTPLNTILGFSQVMASSNDLSNTQKEHLKLIGHSGEHLLGLINDVLDIAKIESGKLELAPSEILLSQLLNELHSFFQSSLIKKNLTMKIEVAENIPDLLFLDKIKLRQILVNLINNAIKFTSEGGVTVNISSEKKEGGCIKLLFTVEDTGCGIKEKDIPEIFTSFVQINNELSHQEGTGLGLAISSKLCALMSGKLSVTSKWELGTIFTFYIITEVGHPKIKENLAKNKIKKIPGKSPKNFRILIVDDEQPNRLLLQSALSPLGFQCREAENGEQAVDLYKQWKPHIVLMDIRMPVMNGYKATKIIKELSPESIIIVVTASVFEDKKKTIEDLGADDFISKPLIIYDLLSMIKKHISVEYKDAVLNKKVEHYESNEEIFSTLNNELREQLKQAIFNIDVDETQKIINIITNSNASLALVIQEKIDHFEYEQLLKLLD
ncbi:MAG: response regulator, partial [Methyloprofundus sp.]|nr:response regulator [Methyloprofundus sp.]